MELIQQVCSLEFAKQLKRLGIKQDSVFYWYYSIYTHEDFRWKLHYINYNHDEADRKIFKENRETYSAFTVAELGILIPDFLWSDTASGSDRTFHYSKLEGVFYVGIRNANMQVIPVFYSENEANARTMMLIYLIENKLMELPK